MNQRPMNPNLLQLVRRRQSGSAILAVLGILAVTLIAVGMALFATAGRSLSSHQSGRWSQAKHAAEAGVELALMSAQNNSWTTTTDPWTSAPGAPGAAAVTKTFTLSTGVPATGPTSAAVSVDTITLEGASWVRIRSTGRADLSGGAVSGADASDVTLRKLSLRRDRASGASVGAAPRATRTLEVLAAPAGNFPFRYGFVSKSLFDIHTLTTSDSYDSSDPGKSNFTPFTTYGTYDVLKRGNNGDIGTIDPLSDWNLNSAHIRGTVRMPTTTKNALNTSNVYDTPAVIKGFTFSYPAELAPSWPIVTQDHGAVTNVSKTINAGTQASPTRHKFSILKLDADNKNIRVQNPVGQTESWVELWVTGDVYIDAKNQTGIKIDPGVHATIHFGSKVEIKGGNGGYALSNDSKLPANLIVRAYGGNAGSIQDFSIAYTDFWGVVSAPWYKVKFDMNGKHVHGSFMTWQFDATDGTNMHYDEALAKLSLGSAPGFKVRSWIEAVR